MPSMSRDPVGRMWVQAFQMLDEAERLHRQFFRLVFPRGARAAWEPPVDVFEDERELVVVVALPGVAPGDAEAAIEGRTLVIRAQRRLPLEDRSCSVQRLEIPQGYFERRLELPAIPLELAPPEWLDGCMVLTVRKRPR
jgi:HSP20 family molecular chaperone IbpA